MVVSQMHHPESNPLFVFKAPPPPPGLSPIFMARNTIFRKTPLVVKTPQLNPCKHPTSPLLIKMVVGDLSIFW